MEQHDSVTPGARLARGWLAALLSTFCAGSSHYLADASAPDPVLLLLAVAGAGVVCVLLAGRRMGPVRVGVAVVLSQGAYHALFSVPTLDPGAVSAVDMAAHGHHATATFIASPVASSVDAHGDGAMVAAHVLAALLTFVVLRHGERSWWALVDALRTEIGVVLALVLPLIPAARPVRRSGQFFLPVWDDTVRVRGGISRRGPPAPVV